jgi:hypothetical protein
LNSDAPPALRRERQATFRVWTYNAWGSAKLVEETEATRYSRPGDVDYPLYLQRAQRSTEARLALLDAEIRRLEDRHAAWRPAA